MTLVLASWTLYVALALSVGMHRTDGYLVERTAFMGAVSMVAFDRPLGVIDQATAPLIVDFSQPAQDLINQVVRGRPDGVRGIVNDGTGIGYVVVSSLAMRVLGPDVFAPAYLMFLLMLLAALVFAWRCPDVGDVAVPLYFASLSILLFTPLVSNPLVAAQIPVGGVRYYSLLAILPALHLCFEIADERASQRQSGTYIALASQAVILTLAMLVRNTAAIFIGAFALIAVVAMWQRRGQGDAARRIFWKSLCPSLAGAIVIAGLLLWLPRAYTDEDRAGSLVWHRVFIGFGADPAWPFPGLRERYDCFQHAPNGLTTGVEDSNGGCVWLAYAKQHDLSPNEIQAGVYGTRYNRALRDAVLDVVTHYPREAFETFFYYKPQLIYYSVRTAAVLEVRSHSAEVQCLLFMSMSLALLCASRRSNRRAGSLLRLFGVAAVLALTQVFPPLVAWANWVTVSDLAFWVVFLAAAAFAGIIGSLAACVRTMLGGRRSGASP